MTEELSIWKQQHKNKSIYEQATMESIHNNQKTEQPNSRPPIEPVAEAKIKIKAPLNQNYHSHHEIVEKPSQTIDNSQNAK